MVKKTYTKVWKLNLSMMILCEEWVFTTKYINFTTLVFSPPNIANIVTYPRTCTFSLKKPISEPQKGCRILKSIFKPLNLKTFVLLLFLNDGNYPIRIYIGDLHGVAF